MADSDSLPCHLCGHAHVEPLVEYAALRRVTSDCKPWAAGGWLGVCRACGGAQKRMDAKWRGEIEQVYRDYTIYHQSGGTEQAVFAADTGQAQARSERLVARLTASGLLPARGRALDVGCGNGAFLHALSRLAAGWSLAGTEINDKYKADVEAIPGVEVMQVGGPGDLAGRFDLISLVHVLEHVPSPAGFLNELRAKLNPGGLLLIEVPYHVENPFDLLIVDHSTHFSAQVLGRVAEAGGFKVRTVATDWVAKELTLVAQPAEALALGSLPDEMNFTRALAVVRRRLAWLNEFARAAKTAAETAPVGIFGTSIAANWLAVELAERVGFFVDEDPARVGRSHLGRPVLASAEIPAGPTVCLALAPQVAAAVHARLASSGRRFLCPPPLVDEPHE